jgi:hypothetical protein
MTLKRANTGGGFVFSNLWNLGEKSKKTAGNRSKIPQHNDWALPAKRAKTCCGVNEHEREVDSQHQCHAMPGQWKVGATIKKIGDSRANNEFHSEKRDFTMIQHAGHQAIPLGRDIETDPNERELRIEPVHCE